VKAQHTLPKPRSFLSRSVRVLASIGVCLVFLVGAMFFGAYLFLQGKTEKGSILVTQIESQMQSLVGSQFEVSIENVELDLSLSDQSSIIANNVDIRNSSNNLSFSKVGKLDIKTNLRDALSGVIAFDSLQFRAVQVDTAALNLNSDVLLPPYLDKPLNGFGEVLSRINESFETQGIKSFEVTDAVITGPVLGRKETDPIRLSNLIVEPTSNGFSLKTGLNTELSPIVLNSKYTKQEAGGEYAFTLDNLHLGEWLNDPDSLDGFVGSNAIVNVSAQLPFDAENRAIEPKVTFTTTQNDLRLGLNANTRVKDVELNFRLILDRNQIELDPSKVSAGRLQAELIGGIKPSDDSLGYAGPLRYDFIMKHGTFEPVLEAEKSVPAAFKVAGIYNRDEKKLGMDTIIMTTKNGAVTGAGEFMFDGETPSLRAGLDTEGISALAIKQFWPFFIAPGARKWLHDHIIAGDVTSGTVQANIPPGILFRIRKGAKLKPEHLDINLRVKDFAFRPFGEMPPIREGVGTIKLEGMKVSADLDSGAVTDVGKKDVKIQSGSFVMEDFAAKEREGAATLKFSGDARTIATISDRKPLRVMERLKVDPEQFSGEGSADIVAKFPVGRRAKYQEVDWNVLIDLQNGKSSKKIDGRTFSDADLLIDANPAGAKVTGTASINGVKTDVRLTEPIGKSGKVKRSRQVVSVLTEKERKALGLDLAPYLTGPIKIKIQENGKGERYEMDLTNTEISLPWVGWSKGKKIKATAEFELQRLKGKKYGLKYFTLKGTGFSAGGELVVDKRGIVSASIQKLSLNEEDVVDFRLERTKDAYNINASGLSYDARSVINSLIFDSGFAKAQGERSVNLVANFDKVRGFGNRIVRNALLIYESRKGSLHKLDLSANGSDGRVYAVKAQRNGDQTQFVIDANDAGTALAFTNIYSRMEGGRIRANLVKSQEGPYLGPVRIENFTVVNEPRIARLASDVNKQVHLERGDNNRRQVVPVEKDKRVKFQLGEARIEKGNGYFNLTDAVLRSAALGITLNGILYDQKDKMALQGTFMPANGVNLAFATIPILGQLFSNGRDNALIGITYKLQGPRTNPELLVNPLSVVAPGIFKKVFEFR
ncbi:MAG: hypothetical protein AAGF54_13125, partial [Pseudomonadota bacterium]